MKRQYMEPQMKVVRIKRMTMICSSELHSVRIDTANSMGAGDDFE